MNSQLLFNLGAAVICCLLATGLLILSASNNAHLFGETTPANSEQTTGRIFYFMMAILCYLSAVIFILAAIR